MSFYYSIFLTLKFVPSPISKMPFEDCISLGIDLENVVFEVTPFFSDFKLFLRLFLLFFDIS
jgi:hypothetical protein